MKEKAEDDPVSLFVVSASVKPEGNLETFRGNKDVDLVEPLSVGRRKENRKGTMHSGPDDQDHPEAFSTGQEADDEPQVEELTEGDVIVAGEESEDLSGGILMSGGSPGGNTLDYVHLWVSRCKS